MADMNELESLYREAQSALKGRDYVRASDLLRQILVIDENYKDTSRLLAQMVKLRRRRWYNHPLLWGGLGLAVLVMVGIWLAPRVRGLIASQMPTPSAMPTGMPTPTIAPTPTPTPIPLAWKRIYIGQEFPRDTITVIAFDPKDPDVIYVGTQNAGIYKSIYGGLSWQPAHKGLGAARVHSLVIDSQDPQTLYAGIALGGVYKTTDGGNNWYSINNGVNINGHEQVSMIAISPGDSRRLYYLQGQNLYTSSDGGASWTEIITGGETSSDCPRSMDSMAIDPANPSRLFVLNIIGTGEDIFCKEGVYKSEDGGQSWMLAFQFEPAGNWVWGWTSLAFDAAGENFYASNKQTVYLSSDHGETWQPLRRIEDCHVLSVDPTDGTRAYCASNDRITSTQDGGANWPILREGLSYAQSIAVSPHSGQAVFVGWDGLWITTDNGESWTVSNNGLGAIHMELSFDPLDLSALLLEDEKCTIYRSTDGGREWDPAPDQTCYSKTALSASGEWLFWIDKNDGSLQKSNNPGATPQKMVWPIENINPAVIVSHPTATNRLFAVYELEYPYFFISDDHGETWRGATLFGWDKYKHADPASRMFFDHEQGQRIYLVTFADVYRSDDAGESWQVCSNPHSDLGNAQRKSGMLIQPENADHILLATRGNGILVSSDGCMSWQSSNSGLGSTFLNTIVMDPNNPDTLYAGTDGGAFISFDGGGTWHPINDGLLGATVVYSIVVDKDSNVYAATPYGIFKLESK